MSTQSASSRYFAGPCNPLPPNCVAVELKYCEICGNLFVRKDRDCMCFHCHASAVQPPITETPLMKIAAEEVPILQ